MYIKNKKNIIVFGGSSYIGQHLCRYFSKNDKLLAGTYCNSPKKDMYYFDLKKPELTNFDIDLGKAKYAIICSAMTKIDECKAREKESYQINVEGTKKLIKQLFERDILPIFLSSCSVFDGEKGHYEEEDKKNPNSVYGKQKKEIEDFLLNSKKDFLIVRISKIFGLVKGDKTFLTDLAEQLLNNKTVSCATDQVFSFTYVEDLVKVLDLAIEKGLKGLYNVASPEAYSRFDLSNMLKSQLKIKTGKIIPCSIKDFDFLDNRGLDTSLNPGKINKAIGFEFTKIISCIDRLKEFYFKE